MGRRTHFLRSYLMTQQDHPSKGDWITTVKENLEDIQMDMELESIAGLSSEDKITF